MHLVTYQRNDESRTGFILLNRIIDLQDGYLAWLEQTDPPPKNQIRLDSLITDWMKVLQGGASTWNIIKSIYQFITKGFNHIAMPASDKIDDGQVTLLPPILRPGKIICVGLNYPPAPGFSGDKPPYPILFNKVASALTGHHGEVIIPKISTKVEYEGELAVIIGKYGKNIPLQEALNWVAGYSIANDIGASDIQARSSQWASGKMFDTFCPLGPAIVSTDELPASENLNITTYLNGKIVQDGWTGDMYYSVSELISYISTLTSLEPGDLILTGSPKCIGMQPDPRLSLIPGDTIEVKITGLGSLSNKVVQEDG